MLERGVEVDHTTIYRWVQHYAPEIEKRLRRCWKPTMGYSWRASEIPKQHCGSRLWQIQAANQPRARFQLHEDSICYDQKF